MVFFTSEKRNLDFGTKIWVLKRECEGALKEDDAEAHFFHGKQSNAFVVMFLEQENVTERRRQLQVSMDSRKDGPLHMTDSCNVTLLFLGLGATGRVVL